MSEDRGHYMLPSCGVIVSYGDTVTTFSPDSCIPFSGSSHTRMQIETIRGLLLGALRSLEEAVDE